MAISLVAAVAVQAQKKRSFFTAGKYTGIKPSGKPYVDFEGIDVYLAQSADATYALVTRANGIRLEPQLVEVKTSGKDSRSIEFSIEDKKVGKIEFHGTVTAAGIKLDKGEAAVGLDAGTMLKRSCGGTFSDIKLGKGGDYDGMEVYLVDGGWRWWALVTTAEGTIDTPILVEAKVTGKKFNNVVLTLPGNRDGRVMKGSISADRSTLTLKDTNGDRTVLRSKCYQ
jgi:hypothetical protein